MSDGLGYRGKKIVMTGIASGMGEAAARLLLELGAEIHALDIAPVTLPVAQVIRTDMKDQASIDAALAALPSEIEFLFNCAGVPSPPFGQVDLVMINFTGMRYLTDALAPRLAAGGGIASIASTAGMAWRDNLAQIDAFLALKDFAAQQAWLAQTETLKPDPYSFSKQCLIVYCMRKTSELAARNIRINCIAPAPTATPFIDKQSAQYGLEVYKLFMPSIGRFATPAEMGNALVLLNSNLATFISGLCIPVDFGYVAEVLTGERENLLGLS
jgi:NAD(P)-dependent dehydrogenase (short-subunit alcohol dehydrogenase family)